MARLSKYLATLLVALLVILIQTHSGECCNCYVFTPSCSVEVIKKIMSLFITSQAPCLSLFLIGQSVGLSVLVDDRIPIRCSSPGWKEAPYDVSTVVGSYVYFNCRSTIPHKKKVWLYQGKEVSSASSLAKRLMIYRSNTSLRLGPVTAEDNDIAIGCEVITNYGPLPSSVGKITVLSKHFAIVFALITVQHYNNYTTLHTHTHTMNTGAPRYSPKSVQVANVGQAFDFDFNYTAKSPPRTYAWYKNGRPFKPDGKRVTVDHTGIIFTRILQEDSGQYTVRASTRNAGSAEATSTLRGKPFTDFFPGGWPL